MKEYGSEAPRKFFSPSKYRDLDSPPPTTDLPRVSVDDMQTCTLKLYNFKKKFTLLPVKSYWINKSSSYIEPIFQKMPFWRLMVVSYFCFIHSKISEFQDKWRKQPLFLETPAQGWTLLSLSGPGKGILTLPTTEVRTLTAQYTL